MTDFIGCLAAVLTTGGWISLYLAIAGKPLSLMTPYWLIVIPALFINTLFLFFTTGAFHSFKKSINFFIHQIRARFFPSEFEKLVSGVLDDIEKSDVLADKIIRLQGSGPKMTASLNAENGDDASGGRASVGSILARRTSKA